MESNYCLQPDNGQYVIAIRTRSELQGNACALSNVVCHWLNLLLTYLTVGSNRDVVRVETKRWYNAVDPAVAEQSTPPDQQRMI